MSKHRTAAKPCTIRVTRFTILGHLVDTRTVTDRDGNPRIYRSIREARRRILDAGQHFDTLSSASHEVEIVPLVGEPKPVDAASSYVWQELEWGRRDNCIGARLGRGEAVAI